MKTRITRDKYGRYRVEVSQLFGLLWEPLRNLWTSRPVTFDTMDAALKCRDKFERDDAIEHGEWTEVER